jgi:hypothetical protein
VTDNNGNLIGRVHKNPLLDTQMYELEYDDGKVDRFMANAITENIYSQMDSEGRQSVTIREIIGHCKDQTLTQQDIVNDGNSKQTTKGWWFLVECNDGHWNGLV